MIIRHSLFAKNSPVEAWIGEGLARLRDDELTEIYLRNQVAESHWSALLDGLQWLSPERRSSDTWRYWAARAMSASGDREAAGAIFTELAGNRSFHGYLSAQRMGEHYQLAAEQPRIDPWQPALHAHKVLARMRELALLNRWPEARAEWLFLVDTMDRAERERAMHYALEQEWFDLSIATSIRAGAWDDIAARFPLAFEELLSELASREGVTTSELQAIARRESAMYPAAESGAGALGLMQVMPGTGKQVAGQLKLPWKRAKLLVSEYNARIASHYYRQLLDRFDDNRAMALAGYNAGPHRVDRWRTAMPADQWIESLPFKETRDYVQAVLAYTVIYDLQSGRKPDILRPHEWLITSG
jgi:soluble lytic murein transglycosylase